MSRSVFIVDNGALQRESLRAFLEFSGYAVMADGSELPEPEELGLGCQGPIAPDLGLVGLTAVYKRTACLRRWGLTQTKMVVVAHDFSGEAVKTCLRLGVSGFLRERMSPEAFLASLALVLAGELVFPTNLKSILLGRNADCPREAAGDGADDPFIEALMAHPNLAPRDLFILSCIMNGQSNKQIAQALLCSEDAIKIGLKQIMRKINVKNRTQAALWAARSAAIRDGALQDER